MLLVKKSHERKRNQACDMLLEEMLADGDKGTRAADLAVPKILAEPRSNRRSANEIRHGLRNKRDSEPSSHYKTM